MRINTVDDNGKGSNNEVSMGRGAQSVRTSGLELLIEWANNQDHWIRKVADTVIKTRTPLSDEHVTDIYELFLCEKKLAEGNTPNVERLSIHRISEPTSEAMWLSSLKHIENVNALTPNQEIQFHRRLTVCFGENGTGKTGYVRILKQAASVRTAQSVLPNIHAGEVRPTPRAIIGVSCGDDDRTIDWTGERSVDPLTRIVVFDARTAVVHINEDLTYSYTPSELSLFPLVIEGIERVQTKLQTAKEERRPKQNPAANLLPKGSLLHTQLSSLSNSKSLHDFETLARVSDEDETGIPSLREQIAILSSGLLQQSIAALAQKREVLSQIATVARTVITFDWDAYLEALVALRKARTNHQQAGQEALADEKIPGALDNAWQEFVTAAEGYIRNIALDPYPELDAPCIYCRQPLDNAAVGLIQKYRDYLNNTLRREVQRADERVQILCEVVRNLQLDEKERDLNRLRETVADPESIHPVSTAARAVIQQGRLLKQAIETEEDCRTISESILYPMTLVQAALEACEIELNGLCDQSSERERILEETKAKLLDIESRITIRELMPVIKDYVKVVEWVKRCDLILQSFPNVKRSLTETAKSASNEVMNHHFRELFQQECESLRAPSVTLDFPGREGQSHRRKSLTPDHSISEILSEGEQKVIALADFLAEASLNPDHSPIVLDDPVTSLDHKRLSYVVNRLVDLSRNRQVIVFTHDIWFAAELLSRFELEPKECTFYNVTNEDQRIGVIERASHPRTDTFNRDSPYWESSGSKGNPNEMVASSSGPARLVNLRSIR